jgi:hypothetical protein
MAGRRSVVAVELRPLGAAPVSAICPYCGGPEVFEVFEVWQPGHEFTVATCCEESEEDARWTLANDPEGAAALLRQAGVEEIVGHQLRRVADDDGHVILDWELEIRPIEQRDAKAFIREHHEHNPPPAGDRFRASIWNAGQLLGVVMVGRPVARALDHTRICEVNRLCLDRAVSDQLRWKAASALYTWAAQETRARGFAKVITYTLESESGMSLRYARWKPEATTKGGSWDTPARRRTDKAPTERKVRWAKTWKAAA